MGQSGIFRRAGHGRGMSIRWLAVAGMTTLAAAALGAAPASAATTSTVALTVVVDSTQPNPGDIQVQDLGGNVLGTCQGPSSPGTATCTYNIASGTGLVLIAQPITSSMFKTWTAGCSGAPGPICHIRLTSPKTAVGHLAAATATPVATTTSPLVDGDAPGCSGFSDNVTVNGTGFPITTAVTLSDDGVQVASGTTDGSGFAQLSYTASSEPGVYRSLVMASGALTASTDIFNVGSVCYTQNTANNQINFTVVMTDMDANSSQNTAKFAGNPTIVLTANSAGVATTTTPSYQCRAGTTTKHLVTTSRRGAGTRSVYTGVVNFQVTC